MNISSSTPTTQSSLSNVQENALPNSTDKLEAYLPHFPLELIPKKTPKPFLRITVHTSCTSNSIPKTHLCGLKTLVKGGVLKTRAEKVAKLMDLQVPVSQEILTLVYEQLENASFFFDRTVTYPVLFKCSFKNIGKPTPKFFLEVHKTGKVFLLIFNHPSTTIAEGGFKTVIKVYDLKDPAVYAYAFSKLSNDTHLDSYLNKNEEDFLGLFNGIKQIIKVYSLHYYEEHQIILMEYYPQDLFSIIEQLSDNALSISPQTKVNYCRQILETIRHLHDRHVIHRDIKADNFLIEDKGTKGHRLKIADFGLACYDDDQDRLSLAVGTPNHLAPEGWDKKTTLRGKPLDIWAAGCIFWLIWNEAAYPWYDHDLTNKDDQKDLMKELLWFHNRPPSFENHREVLLWYMLHLDPEKRWTVERCLDYLDQYGSSFR